MLARLGRSLRDAACQPDAAQAENKRDDPRQDEQRHSLIPRHRSLPSTARALKCRPTPNPTQARIVTICQPRSRCRRDEGGHDERQPGVIQYRGEQLDPLVVDGGGGTAHVSRSIPACRNSGSVMRRRWRSTGPIRRCSMSHRRLPGSHKPPALRMSGARSTRQRTVPPIGRVPC